MLARLRQVFARLTLRERVLAGLFVWTLLVLGFNAVIGQLRSVMLEVRVNRQTIADYTPLVAQADAVADNLTRLRARFDPNRTFGPADLAGRVDELMNQASVRSERLDVSSTPVGLFDEHSIRLRFENVDLVDLLRLSDLIKAESPYLYLESLRLTDDSRNPLLLDVPTMEINSFELGAAIEAP